MAFGNGTGRRVAVEMPHGNTKAKNAIKTAAGMLEYVRLSLEALRQAQIEMAEANFAMAAMAGNIPADRVRAMKKDALRQALEADKVGGSGAFTLDDDNTADDDASDEVTAN